MKSPTSTTLRNGVQSAVRPTEWQRLKATLARTLCLCGNRAVHLSSCGPACQRCLVIEARLTSDYSKHRRGRRDNLVPVVMPYAVHCGME